MAADVSCSADANQAGKSPAPITRDLLGGCCTSDSKELDLDLQVPCGWEKRLDLKSGKVYLQKNTSSSNTRKFQDLNFPPSSKQTLNLFQTAGEDLKLVSRAAPSNYDSVCTLDKVRLALERAEKEGTRKRSSVSVSMSKSSCSPRSTSSSSVVDVSGDLDREERSPAATIATGCPRCLLYVLVSRDDPKCPKCNGDVPLPAVETRKKPRIDLNISI